MTRAQSWLSLCLSAALAALVPRVAGAAAVAGVDPSSPAAHAYTPDAADPLFRCLDGSKSIPSAQLNDDYCDCRDGSDEPGTSACRGGRFFCENAGHASASIYSSRVGDGVCDCCDGSDEPAAACENVCDAAQAAASAARRAQALREEEGAAARARLVNDARARVRAAAEGADAVSAATAAAKTRLDALDASLSAAEAVAEEEVAAKRDAARAALYAALHLDSIDDIALLRRLLLDAVAADDEVASSVVGAVSAALDVDESQLLASTASQIEALASVNDAEDSESVVAAREARDAAQRELSDAEAKVEDGVPTDIDFGPDSVWLTLHKQCFDLSSKGFRWNICLFDDARQDYTSVGHWQKESWGGERGFAKMHFAHGQRCPNGISRTLELSMRCGPSSKLLSVDEPSMCEYAGVFETPAACTPV